MLCCVCIYAYVAVAAVLGSECSYLICHTVHIALHCSEVLLQAPMRHKLHDEHYWEGGGDTAKHLEDMWVAAVRDPLHHVNLIQKELPFFATAAT